MFQKLLLYTVVNELLYCLWFVYVSVCLVEANELVITCLLFSKNFVAC